MLIGVAAEKESLLKKINRLTKENEELRHKCSSAQIAESARVLSMLSDFINR